MPLEKWGILDSGNKRIPLKSVLVQRGISIFSKTIGQSQSSLTNDTLTDHNECSGGIQKQFGILDLVPARGQQPGAREAGESTPDDDDVDFIRRGDLS